MAETVFYVFAGAAVVSALLCIVQRNPIASAFWLISTMLALAGIYVLLSAPFIAAIQVLVYAGAIMVLFLFVIMLLNLGRAASDLRGRVTWVVTLALVGVLAATLLAVWGYTPERLAQEVTGSPDLAPAVVFRGGTAATTAAGETGRNVIFDVAAPLFQTYLVPFEITSILLLAAIVGAVVLAKRRL